MADYIKWEAGGSGSPETPENLDSPLGRVVIADDFLDRLLEVGERNHYSIPITGDHASAHIVSIPGNPRIVLSTNSNKIDNLSVDSDPDKVLPNWDLELLGDFQVGGSRYYLIAVGLQNTSVINGYACEFSGYYGYCNNNPCPELVKFAIGALNNALQPSSE